MGFRTRLRERFHERRAALFIALLAPRPGARLLDLGGGDGSLAARIRERVPLEVTVADVRADNREACLARGFEHVLVGQGPLPFEANAYDFVLCNSVIEHVTLPAAECRVDRPVASADWAARARAAQRTFAAEIERVGRAFFVQTPDRRFPIDQHLHLPLTNFLAHESLCRVVRVTDRFWVQTSSGAVDWELLTPGDMRHLFPDAHITVERFLGLPKSIVAWRPLSAGGGAPKRLRPPAR
ncbi:MAG: methyltransferase domain-containing protein [Gemmatimonadota bacterium]